MNPNLIVYSDDANCGMGNGCGYGSGSLRGEFPDGGDGDWRNGCGHEYEDGHGGGSASGYSNRHTEGISVKAGNEFEINCEIDAIDNHGTGSSDGFGIDEHGEG